MTLPLVIVGPSAIAAIPPASADVADKLIRALRHGDVALILTRRKLTALIQLLDQNWTMPEEFEILQDLKKLRDGTR